MGWLPYIFLSLWFNQIESKILILVLGLGGFCLCILGSFYLHLESNIEWDKKVEEKRKEYEKAIKLYQEARDKLVQYVLKKEKNENNN